MVIHDFFAKPDTEQAGVQVHVGWLEGGTAVFAFRGTASRQDGLQDVKIFSRNIDYLQELYPGVKAHLGAPLLYPFLCSLHRSTLTGLGETRTTYLKSALHAMLLF